MNPNQNFNQAGQNTQAPTQEPLKIDVTPIAFDGLIKSKLISTIGLGKLVWNLFKPVFPEYEGCVILPDQYGQLQVTLYFKDKGKITDSNLVKAIAPVGMTQPTSNAFERIASINQRLSSKKFELTKDAKDILSDFFWVKGNNKVNWSQFVTEVISNDYNGYSVHLKVTGLDINRILRKIYGSKVKGSRVDYSLSIVKPIGVDGSGLLQNYLISIQQLDTREVENLAREIGVIPVQGTIPMLKG